MENSSQKIGHFIGIIQSYLDAKRFLKRLPKMTAFEMLLTLNQPPVTESDYGQ
ncbi:hypothetical protein [Cytobacillus luteolus]|uniref:hypothetical protein n=1 Tax=Litchfieldia luteola TaxID=682179 RepID=UPI001CB3EB3F|nr:hypothetical protein [Cytobacillus luteolus]MBP1942254.1 hypothetical protein [Cytobacillus luteolus]